MPKTFFSLVSATGRATRYRIDEIFSIEETGELTCRITLSDKTSFEIHGRASDVDPDVAPNAFPGVMVETDDSAQRRNIPKPVDWDEVLDLGVPTLYSTHKLTDAQTYRFFATALGAAGQGFKVLEPWHTNLKEGSRILYGQHYTVHGIRIELLDCPPMLAAWLRTHMVLSWDMNLTRLPIGPLGVFWWREHNTAYSRCADIPWTSGRTQADVQAAYMRVQSDHHFPGANSHNNRYFYFGRDGVRIPGGAVFNVVAEAPTPPAELQDRGGSIRISLAGHYATTVEVG
jgi:hypothetical protein